MLSEWLVPGALGLASQVLLWAVVLLLGFLLLGALRALALLQWRLEQLEATTPSRVGRSGLRPGKKAPDFTLPSVAGSEVALHQFAGRKVLLVFTQTGCGPCRQLVPELNRLVGHALQVVVVHQGDRQTTCRWAAAESARFPVLIQEGWELSRQYEVFATPFAFLIDEQAVIAAKGIVKNKQHLGFLVSAGPAPASEGQAAGPTAVAGNAAAVSLSSSNVEEHDHV